MATRTLRDYIAGSQSSIRTPAAERERVAGPAASLAGPPGAGPRGRRSLARRPEWAQLWRVGSEDIRNFLAIGDTTNLAARIQTLARPGQRRAFLLRRAAARP